MFNCGLCHASSATGESAVHVVTETRGVEYPRRTAAHHFIDRSGMERTTDDPGGKGIETVHEVLAHERCARLYAAAKQILA